MCGLLVQINIKKATLKRKDTFITTEFKINQSRLLVQISIKKATKTKEQTLNNNCVQK